MHILGPAEVLLSVVSVRGWRIRPDGFLSGCMRPSAMPLQHLVHAQDRSVIPEVESPATAGPRPAARVLGHASFHGIVVQFLISLLRAPDVHVAEPTRTLYRPCGAYIPTKRRCEKIKQLTRRRQGAETRKEELPCFLFAFRTFAPLREMLLLFGRFFHTFRPSGRMRHPPTEEGKITCRSSPRRHRRPP